MEESHAPTRIMVDDQPVVELSETQKSLLIVRDKYTSADAELLSADAATRRRMWRKLTPEALTCALGVVSLGAGVFTMLGHYYSEYGPLPAFGMLALGVFVMPLSIRHIRHEIHEWNTMLRERRLLLPPHTCVVSFNPSALTLDGHHMAWPDIELESVHFRYFSETDSNIERLIVERLVMLCAGKRFALDETMMRDGRIVIDHVYRRLCAGAQSSPLGTGSDAPRA